VWNIHSINVTYPSLERKIARDAEVWGNIELNTKKNKTRFFIVRTPQNS
jgi:hypothetical protein